MCVDTDCSRTAHVGRTQYVNRTIPALCDLVAPAFPPVEHVNIKDLLHGVAQSHTFSGLLRQYAVRYVRMTICYKTNNEDFSEGVYSDKSGAYVSSGCVYIFLEE